MKSHPLVSRFFHSFDNDGIVKWQGHIEESCGDGFFLVQLFEWITGSPSDMKLVHMQSMSEWSFYESAEEMNDVFNRRLQHRVKAAN